MVLVDRFTVKFTSSYDKLQVCQGKLENVRKCIPSTQFGDELMEFGLSDDEVEGLKA